MEFVAVRRQEKSSRSMDIQTEFFGSSIGRWIVLLRACHLDFRNAQYNIQVNVDTSSQHD